jgi:hypothetical protein
MFLDGARLSASAIIKSFAGTWEIVYLNLISLMRNRCNLGVNSSRSTAFVDMIMESFPASNNRLEEIRREQASDPIIQELSRLWREGWTKKSKVRTVQFLTTSSSCLLIPSHQTVFLACSRHFTIPWCASCNLFRMSLCRTAGITKLVHLSRSPS